MAVKMRTSTEQSTWLLGLGSLFLSMSKENFLRDSPADFPSHLIGSSANHSFGKKDETTMTGLNQSSFKALWLGRSPTVLKGCDHLSKVNRIRMLLARKMERMASCGWPRVPSTVHPWFIHQTLCSVHSLTSLVMAHCLTMSLVGIGDHSLGDRVIGNKEGREEDAKTRAEI